MDLSKKISLKIPLALSENLLANYSEKRNQQSFIKRSSLEIGKQSQFLQIEEEGREYGFEH